MKGLLVLLGMLASTVGCSQSGEDASWPGFHAMHRATICASNADCGAGSECELGTEQGASLGQCKAHDSTADKADRTNERRSRRDRPRRRSA
jgi:hypothetical protein